MRFSKKHFIVIVLFTLLAFFVFLLKEEVVYPEPIKAFDTDGTPSEEIIYNMKKGYEFLVLKTYPFGFLEVLEWEKVSFPKEIYAIVEWKAYKDLGAGNIYIGYSFDGKKYFEIGPLNFSDEQQITEVRIPSNIFTDVSKIKVRFRGEDLDFGPEAFAEVKIRLKVIRYKIGL